jgi:hypothetical protein
MKSSKLAWWAERIAYCCVLAESIWFTQGFLQGMERCHQALTELQSDRDERKHSKFKHTHAHTQYHTALEIIHGLTNLLIRVFKWLCWFTWFLDWLLQQHLGRFQVLVSRLVTGLSSAGSFVQ